MKTIYISFFTIFFNDIELELEKEKTRKRYQEKPFICVIFSFFCVLFCAFGKNKASWQGLNSTQKVKLIY